ncbi:hypothetical protein RI367_001939 [Sorochytrium milnesiophthora]
MPMPPKSRRSYNPLAVRDESPVSSDNDADVNNSTSYLSNRVLDLSAPTLKRQATFRRDQAPAPLTSQLHDDGIKTVTITGDGGSPDAPTIRGYVSAQGVKRRLIVPDSLADVQPADILQPATSLAEFAGRPENKAILKPNYKPGRKSISAAPPRSMQQPTLHAAADGAISAATSTMVSNQVASDVRLRATQASKRIGMQLDMLNESIKQITEQEHDFYKSVAQWTHVSRYGWRDARYTGERPSVPKEYNNNKDFGGFREEDGSEAAFRNSQDLCMNLYALSSAVMGELETLQKSVSHKITQRDHVWREIKRKLSESKEGERVMEDDEEDEVVEEYVDGGPGDGFVNGQYPQPR